MCKEMNDTSHKHRGRMVEDKAYLGWKMKLDLTSQVYTNKLRASMQVDQ